MKKTDYNSIAPYYDMFNKGFDYKHYFDSIIDHLKRYTSLPFGSSTALDLGCGTGELIKYIKNIGFDCCGLDNSEEMLFQASSKEELAGCMFIHQDIKEIDLFRAYDLIFCCADVLNHITDNKDLDEFFDKIYNFTEMNGYLIFDLKTLSEFERNTRSDTIEIDSITLKYTGHFSEPDMITCLEIDDNGHLIKENIKERYYSDDYIKDMIKHSRFKFIESYSYKDDERIIYILRKET